VGDVSFHRVNFSYVDGRPILHEFSLHINPGTKVAIVGRTGSGKTTVMNLLLGFYQPSSGHICIDDQPLCEFSTAKLRQHIGVVPQEAVIFRGTLAENICYGTPEAGPEQMEAAARAALVHDLALSLPQQYNTLVGEGGHPLSHGERQRIALARLFCKSPAIVVLDEATSSLDQEHELLVQAALQRLLAGRTTLVIAHRLATVQTADQIVVIDEGRIVEVGSHADLLAAEGVYRQLHDAQFAADGGSSIDQPVRHLTGDAVPA
jgi:ABC-type multidrug transport system fused ATPase/permease subunit